MSQELKKADRVSPLHYCHWLLDKIADGKLYLMLYFIDKAWFHLFRHVNSQNIKYWLMEDLHQLHKKLLYNEKWCALSGNHIVGTNMFLTQLLIQEVYFRIFKEFYAQLTDGVHENYFFQQVGETCHKP